MTSLPARGSAARLSARFVLLLAATLMPLGIMSLVQTRSLLFEVQASTSAALLGDTLAAASAETGVIQRIQGVVAALAKVVPALIVDDTACSALMRQIAAEETSASLVAFIPSGGLMTCSSSGLRHDFSGSALMSEVRDARAPNFVVNRNGPISGTSVLGISHPVFADDGAYLGFVSISLPHDRLKAMEPGANLSGGVAARQAHFWTFDRDGEVLTANMPLDAVAARLPVDLPLAGFVDSPGRVFLGRSADGLAQTYAVVPLVPGQLYLMGLWNAPSPTFLERYGVAPYLSPMIMWLVALIVTAWAAEYLVIRHIRALNNAIAAFGRGNRRLEQVIPPGAPGELRDLGEAYQRMVESITLGEAKLEDTIHQKEVLLREVHHRVKNNLQLIASIMNMQMRKAIAPEAKLLLKGLQDRVMSLATIHRGLYQTSGLADVRADELLSDIVRQIVRMSSGPDKRFDLTIDIDDLHLIPDQAVPLSLLLTEAMTNAMKYAGSAPGRAAPIAVRLKRDGEDRAILQVINAMPPGVIATGKTIPGTALVTSTGLGSSLLTAFAQQIGGTLDQTADALEYRLQVRFRVTALAEAEHRRDATVPPAEDPPAA